MLSIKKFYIKSWLLCGFNKNISQMYFNTISFFSHKTVFLNINFFYFSFWKVKILLTSLKSNHFVFVATRTIFSKIVRKPKFWAFVRSRFAGLFSNFCSIHNKAFRRLASSSCPGILIFFHNRKLDLLILESIKTFIPSLGFFSIFNNSSLFMFKVSFNNAFFVNVVFLMKILLRLI